MTDRLPNRDLMKLAVTATDWDASYLGSKYPAHVIRDTAAEIEGSMGMGLKHHEPKLDGSLTKPLRDNLNTLGRSLRPDYSPEQAQAWAFDVIKTLADLPPGILKRASADAIHAPIKFIGEVSATVREIADRYMEAGRTGIARLKEAEEAATRRVDGDDYPRSNADYSKALFRFHRELAARRHKVNSRDHGQRTDLYAWSRAQQIKMRDPLFVRCAPRTLSPDAVKAGVRHGWLEIRGDRLWETWCDKDRNLHHTELDPVDFPIEGVPMTEHERRAMGMVDEKGTL